MCTCDGVLWQPRRHLQIPSWFHLKWNLVFNSKPLTRRCAQLFTQLGMLRPVWSPPGDIDSMCNKCWLTGPLHLFSLPSLQLSVTRKRLSICSYSVCRFFFFFFCFLFSHPMVQSLKLDERGREIPVTTFVHIEILSLFAGSTKATERDISTKTTVYWDSLIIYWTKHVIQLLAILLMIPSNISNKKARIRLLSFLKLENHWRFCLILVARP